MKWLDTAQRANPLYNRTYQLDMESVNISSQALSSSPDINGWSVQPTLFTNNEARVLIGRGTAPNVDGSHDFDWVVTNESLLYIEDVGSGTTLHFRLVDAAGGDVTGGAKDFITITEYH